MRRLHFLHGKVQSPARIGKSRERQWRHGIALTRRLQGVIHGEEREGEGFGSRVRSPEGKGAGRPKAARGDPQERAPQGGAERGTGRERAPRCARGRPAEAGSPFAPGVSEPAKALPYRRLRQRASHHLAYVTQVGSRANTKPHSRPRRVRLARAPQSRADARNSIDIAFTIQL